MSRCFAIFIFESIALHQFLDFLNWVWTNFLGISYPTLPVLPIFLLFFCLQLHIHNSALLSIIGNSLTNCLRRLQQCFLTSASLEGECQQGLRKDPLVEWIWWSRVTIWGAMVENSRSKMSTSTSRAETIPCPHFTAQHLHWSHRSLYVSWMDE